MVLAAEVAVEGLIRETGLAQDVGDLGLQVTRSFDHQEGRGNESPDLVLGGGAPLGEAAIDGGPDGASTVRAAFGRLPRA